jgi:histone deacetylase 11
MLSRETIVTPNKATHDDLRLVHTRRYLSSLRSSVVVARVLELGPIAMLPNCLIQRRVLGPLRYQTGGSVLVSRSVRQLARTSSLVRRVN